MKQAGGDTFFLKVFSFLHLINNKIKQCTLFALSAKKKKMAKKKLIISLIYFIK
jgi:hypothetical protein